MKLNTEKESLRTEFICSDKLCFVQKVIRDICLKKEPGFWACCEYRVDQRL